MKQKVLLFVLNKLDLELSVLLLILHDDQFANQVLENVIVGHAVFAFGSDLVKHVLQAHHIQRTFLKRNLQSFEHQHNEVLDPNLLLGHTTHLLPNFLQFLLEDLPADVDRRILFQRFQEGRCEVLSAVVEGDLHGFLPRDEPPECIFEVTVEFFFLLF